VTSSASTPPSSAAKSAAPDTPGDVAPQVDAAESAAIVLARFAEIRVHVERLLAVQIDRLRILVRESAFRTGALLWLTVVLVAATVGAVVHVLSGLAGALATAFGGREWAGDLAAGGLVLAGLLLGLAAVRARKRRAAFRKMAERYRRRDAKEADAAAGAPSHEGP
jgi:hypothetical protein